MCNIFTNPGFSEGLIGWTYSTGVVASSDPAAPGARLPGQGYLAQWFGDATISSDHLYFFCTPLESTGFRLQVRVDYTDGTTESHETHAAVESPFYFRCDIPVNNHLQLRRLAINNMDRHENSAIILSFFYLCGELADDAEPEGGARGGFRGMRRMSHMDAGMMGARFLDLEIKLDQILEQLRTHEFPPKSKASKKGK